METAASSPGKVVRDNGNIDTALARASKRIAASYYVPHLAQAPMEPLEAGFDGAGKPVAWLHRTVAPTIQSIFAPDPKHEDAFELAMGAVDMPFAIPNVRVENPEAEAHTRIGWLRSVSNIPHAFAIQSFVGELAAALGRDTKDYLLELLGPDRLIGSPYRSLRIIAASHPRAMR